MPHKQHNHIHPYIQTLTYRFYLSLLGGRCPFLLLLLLIIIINALNSFLCLAKDSRDEGLILPLLLLLTPLVHISMLLNELLEVDCNRRVKECIAIRTKQKKSIRRRIFVKVQVKELIFVITFKIYLLALKFDNLVALFWELQNSLWHTQYFNSNHYTL